MSCADWSKATSRTCSTAVGVDLMVSTAIFAAGDDGVHVLHGDVAEHDLDSGHSPSMPPQPVPRGDVGPERTRRCQGLSRRVLIAETGPVTERLRVREIDDDEGRRLVRIVRGGSGSVVTWRRAQMVLLSAQGMDVPSIAEVAFTSADRVRDVIRNFNADGFNSLYPKYKGGRPPKFTLPQRWEIKKIAKSKPVEHDLPFSTWSLAKLAEFLVAEGVVDDISHEGLRVLLREEGVTFQRLKTWKASKDPRYAAKKARVEHLYAIADREVTPAPGDPEVVFCVDESGPLNLRPRPGRQWAYDERLRRIVDRANVA
jgi:transposase